MKRVLALLLVFMLCICALVSCGEEEEEPHVHTFSETWTADAEGHWYAATCECEEVETTKLAHSDKNNDGACDVCEYKIACADGHSYAEEWTVDCTNHWHAADCGHVVAGSGVAAHADANNDGKCDTCFYVIRDIHNHYYDDEWSGDAEYHWHAALCEHGVEVADKAAHVVDAAGYCTVCEAKVSNVNASNIEAVLLAAIARNHKVIDGNVVFSEMVFGGNANALTLSTGGVDEIYFVLGANDSYIFLQNYDMNGNFIGADHQWYERISEKEIFAVQMQHGTNKLQVVSGAEQFLSGYTYHPGSILPSADDDTSTLANTLYNLYSLVKAGTNVSDATESYDATTGEYKIAFNYLDVNATHMSDDTTEYQAYYYQVAIRFTVDANAVINFAEFSVMSYRNWEGDEDISYDPTTNKITFLDSANPTVYSYSVSQRSGDRTYTTIYPKTSLVPTDFELSYVTEIVDGEYGEKVIVSEELLEDKDEDGVLDLELTEESYVYVHLTNLVPVTAIASALDIGDFSVTFVNNDSTSTGALWLNQEEKAPGFSSYTDCITFFAEDAGEYTVTITFGNITKTVNVTVAARQVAPVDPVEDNEFVVETTDTYVYEDEHTFIATKGEGKYTFTLPPFLGIQSKEAKDAERTPEYDVLGVAANEPTYGQPVEVVFELEANEEFVFYVGATTKGNWIISYTYVACDVEDDNQGGGETGGDQGGDTGNSNYDTIIIVGENTLYFSEEEIEEDAAQRKVIISAAGTYEFSSSTLFVSNLVAADGTVITKNEEYNFEIEAGEYTANFSMLSMFGVSADIACTLNVTDVNAEEDDEEEEIENIEDTLSGTYEGVVDGLSLLFYKDSEAGIYYLNIWSDAGDCYYTYTVTENADGSLALVLTYAPDHWMNTGVDSLELSGATVIATPDGDSWSFVIEAAVSNDNELLNGTWQCFGDDSTVAFEFIFADGIITANDYTGGNFAFEESYTYEYDATLGVITVNGTDTMMFTLDRGGNLVYGFRYPLVKLADGDDEAPEISYETVIVVGENTLYFSEEEIEADAAQRKVIISVAGIYKFASSNLFVSNLVAADGTVITKNEEYNFEIEAGEYTANFSMLSMFGVSADAACTLNVTDVNAEGDDEEEELENIEDTLAGTYEGAVDGLSLLFYKDIEAGIYYLNIWSDAGDCYYTYTVTENADGSLALVLTYAPDHWMNTGVDSLELSGATVIATPDGDSWSFVIENIGDEEEPEISYETVIVVGENTLYFSEEEIEADAAQRKVIISVAGIYKFASSNLFVSNLVAADGTVITKNEEYNFEIEAGEYTANFSMLSMFGVSADAACVLNVTDVNAEDDEEEEIENIEDTLAGTYEGAVDGLSLLFYKDIEAGIYYLNIWSDAGDCYYTYTVTENADGSLALVLTYAPDHWMNTGVDSLELSGATVIATPDGDSWSFVIEAAVSNDNELLNGTWQCFGDDSTVAFEFIFADGIITANDYTGGNFAFEESYTYEYDATLGVITVNGTDTMMFTLDMGGNLVYGFRYPLVKLADGDDEAPEISYETVIVVGENTLYFSEEEIEADAAQRKVIISVAGIYKFASSNLFVSNLVAADGTVITKNEEYNFEIEAGEYTANFSMLSMFGVSADAACVLNVTDVNAEDDEEEEIESIEDTLAGAYEGAVDGLSLLFYKDGEAGIYYLNIWSDAGDCYYTYTVTENADGSLALVLTYAPDHWMNTGVDSLELSGATVIATPDGDSWSFVIE